MEQIEHSHLDVRGLRLHVATVGTGESGTVLLLHGFPEIWYSWRHQMRALAGAGYRAVAPDFRGYGLSQPPTDTENSTSWSDLTADLLAILDHLAIPKVFIAAKDFGAKAAYDFALQHPERVSGIVTMGVPFLPGRFQADLLPEGFYILRWRAPGRAERDFGRFTVKTVVRNVYILFSGSEIPIAREDQEIMDLVDPSAPLPTWFTDEDLSVYAELYESSGFRIPLQMPYRASFEFSHATDDPKIQVPALLIMGGKDYVLKFPGIEDYVRSGKVKDYVPHLEITFIDEGSHFVQEQYPEQVNELLISFLNKQKA